ncbi:MAG: T9SS type A sorting domain-containing protein, partial [Candidatus Cloacimonetes bacterium]|nr:T9SS type A sorting domain-containing protein [Candidatus Cloacimonadota bacterium]
RFDVKENENGVLSIYNIKGEIIESKKFITGRHLFEWNASEYSSGIYFLKLQTNTYLKVKKMMLLK